MADTSRIMEPKQEVGMLSAQVSGLPADKETPIIFFMAGFPDDHGTWSMIAPRFASTHTVVTFCMPDYDTPSPTRYWGFSFGMIVAMLDASIKKYACHGQNITLVAHDWGCMMAFLYLSNCEEMVDKFVALDIGLPGFGKVSTKTKVVNLCYQSWLAAAYTLGRLTLTMFGDLMIAIFPWQSVGPCPNEALHGTSPRTSGYQVRSFMAYPYFRIFASMIFGMDSDLMKNLRMPDVPILFVYGKDKRSFFHTQEFIDHLEKTPGCAWEGLDCGHFIQVQKPDELESIMKKFLSVTSTPSTTDVSPE